MIVVDRVGVTVEPMRNNHLLLLKIDVLDFATEEIYVANHFANWIDDISQVQIACCDLVQHRCEEKEVLAIYDSHFESRVAKLFELQRCIQPAKAATENEDTGFAWHTHDLSRKQRDPYKEGAF